VWGYVKFWENRSEYAPTGSYGAFLTAVSQQTNRAAWGAKINVYAKRGSCYDYNSNCNETDDLLLGSPNASSSGYYSVSGASSGDLVYISHEFCNQLGCVRDDNNEWPDTVSTVGLVGSANLQKNYNITCPYDYYNTTPGLCDSQADVNNYFAIQNHFSSILMSMQDVKNRIGSYLVNDYTTEVTVYTPDRPGSSECLGDFNGYTYSSHEVCIDDESGGKNMVIAHELGHVLMIRLLFYPGTGTCPLSSCIGSYGWADSVNEKCVVSEGWADFISTAAHFGDYADDPFFRDSDKNLEGETSCGNRTLKACVSNDSGAPYERRGNAARYFWDLYDSTTEDDDGNDDLDLTLTQIKNIWLEFIDGTDNLRDCESDSDGRNALDYWSYGFVLSINTTSELEKNCLEGQDSN